MGKDKIKQAILSILAEKRRNGDVLPFATSIEVAHLLHMNALDVEKIAEDIEGIDKGKTLNHAWYDIYGENDQGLHRAKTSSADLCRKGWKKRTR